jgi:hypothetical protein
MQQISQVSSWPMRAGNRKQHKSLDYTFLNTDHGRVPRMQCGHGLPEGDPPDFTETRELLLVLRHRCRNLQL